MNFLFKKDIKKMNYLAVILLTFVLAYFFILIFTYFFQRNLLYHPKVNNYLDDKILVNIKKVKITTLERFRKIVIYLWMTNAAIQLEVPVAQSLVNIVPLMENVY